MYSLVSVFPLLTAILAALRTITWSPVSRCWVYVGLCLPERTRATCVARRPSVWPVASTTNQRRSISLSRAVKVLAFIVPRLLRCFAPLAVRGRRDGGTVPGPGHLPR